MKIRWLPLAVVLLAGCQGVLEVQIERVAIGPSASLGQVAHITGGDVWLLDLDSGQSARLTQDGRNRRPRLAPDGTWVAYLKGDELYVVSVAGSEELRLSEAGVSAYAWSPQDGQLAYISTNGLAVWDAGARASRGLPLNLTALNNLRWHPGGDWLAVDNREGSPRQVVKASLDGRRPLVLYDAGTLMDVPRLAAWSPDGRWLAVWLGSRAQAAEQDGLPLCFLHAAGGEPECLVDRTLLWPPYLSWSSDGRLALIAGAGRETWVGKTLVVLEPGALAPRALVPAAEQAPVQPAWSPDGGRIAYSAGPGIPLNVAYEQRERALQERRIWVVDVATGRRQQLTGDDGYRDERPLWSADGSHVLFARLDEDRATLWLMRADGNGLRQVVSELTPRPETPGQYGYIDWGDWWDWNTPASMPVSATGFTGTREALSPVAVARGEVAVAPPVADGPLVVWGTHLRGSTRPHTLRNGGTERHDAILSSSGQTVRRAPGRVL